MEGTSGRKDATLVAGPVASSMLSVNVFTAPGKAMAGDFDFKKGEQQWQLKEKS
jgi:hypothetical protein